MNSLGKALTNKMGKTTDATGLRKVVDYLTGTRRVNNAADPTSAYSMAKRKQANTLPPAKQKGATPGRL